MCNTRRAPPCCPPTGLAPALAIAAALGCAGLLPNPRHLLTACTPSPPSLLVPLALFLIDASVGLVGPGIRPSRAQAAGADEAAPDPGAPSRGRVGLTQRCVLPNRPLSFSVPDSGRVIFCRGEREIGIVRLPLPELYPSPCVSNFQCSTQCYGHYCWDSSALRASLLALPGLC